MSRRGRFVGPASRADGRFGVRRSAPRPRTGSIVAGRALLDAPARSNRSATSARARAAPTILPSSCHVEGGRHAMSAWIRRGRQMLEKKELMNSIFLIDRSVWPAYRVLVHSVVEGVFHPRRKTVREHPIVVTESDARRLRGLLGAHREASLRDQEHLHELKSELERALVVDAAELPAGAITMHSRVQVLDLASGERKEYLLVFPSDADVAARRISVLAPLGTALLGHREGDELEWEMPGGLRRLRVERVIRPGLARAGRAKVSGVAMPAVATGAR